MEYTFERLILAIQANLPASTSIQSHVAIVKGGGVSGLPTFDGGDRDSEKFLAVDCTSDLYLNGAQFLTDRIQSRVHPRKLGGLPL